MSRREDTGHSCRKAIAFAILLVPCLGLAQTRLTDTSAESRYPSPSPDGAHILFESNRTGAWHIYLMNRDGGHVRRVTDRTAEERFPGWSPDGDRIVFNSEGDLYHRVTEVSWSPGGSHLLYAARENEQTSYGIFWEEIPP